MGVSAEQLLAGTTQLSSLPDIYRRLDEAIDAPNSSFSTIGRIIRDDTGFTARVLRIANSALYNFPGKVETVERAMSVIGTKQLRELALSTNVISMFAGLDNTLVSMESFWKHSICCGTAARVIATVRRENNIERYFALGMLHDVGRLVMYNRIPDLCREVLETAQKSERLLHDIEREVIGFNHATVGQTLLAMWKLSHAQIEAVGYHHVPQAAQHYPLETAVVHVADWIAYAMRCGTSGERFVPPLNAAAWARLEISENQIPTIVEHTQKQYDEAVRLFLNND